jgi:hypothetical protein
LLFLVLAFVAMVFPVASLASLAPKWNRLAESRLISLQPQIGGET